MSQAETPPNPAAKKSLLQEMLDRNAELGIRHVPAVTPHSVRNIFWGDSSGRDVDGDFIGRSEPNALREGAAKYLASVLSSGPDRNTTHDAIVAARDVTIRGQGEVITKLAGMLKAEQAVSSERLASMIELGGRLSSMADDVGRVKAEKEALVRELEALRPVRPEPASSAPWGKRHDGRGGSVPE